MTTKNKHTGGKMNKQTEIIYQVQRAKRGAGFEDQAGLYPDRVTAGDVTAGKRLEAEAIKSGETFRIVEIRKRVVG